MGRSFEYFRGVKNALADLPVTLHFPLLPSGESIKTRNEVLAKALESINSEILYLIGHSMGGLNSRYYVSNHPDDKRIKRLITVASPHRGSPLADWVMSSRSPPAMIFRHQYVNGVRDLTATACQAFNDNVLDRDDIEYLSYAAQRPRQELPIWLRPLARHVGDEPNDGQVPVSSAQWGDFKGLLHADHFEAAGWSLALPNNAEQRPFDHISFYRCLVNECITTYTQQLQEQSHEPTDSA